MVMMGEMKSNSKSAHDRPSGLRAFAEVFLIPCCGDVEMNMSDWNETRVDGEV